MQDFETVLREIGPKRILDVATGRGDCIRWLLEMYGDVDLMVGIDVSERAIQAARESISKGSVVFRVMDTADLDLDDESFDMVTICYSLHHLESLEQSLNEMVRVLKPGGWLLIIETYRDDPRESQLTHVYLHDWWAEIDRIAGIPHNKTFTRERIVTLLDDLELTEIQLFDSHGDDEQAKERKMISRLIERNDFYPEKIKDHPRYEEFKARGRELNERLRHIGHTPASQLVALLHKP